MIERLVSPNEKQEVQQEVEKALRPKSLDEYVGQEKIKEKLGIFIQAARGRQETLDHVLLSGPPGLGKTTLAHIIAKEMGGHLHSVTGPHLEKKADLAAILTNLQRGDVLFIDEIHRLHKSTEEILYSAMEDFRMDLILGQGAAARTLSLDVAPFTLVGATTRAGMLSNPLRDRFGVQLRLDLYPVTELSAILDRSSRLLNMNVDSVARDEIAKRSRGTPRVANRLLRRVRDVSEVLKRSVDLGLAKEALTMLDVDPRGLDAMDRKYLEILIDNYNGGPVGIDSLAMAIGEMSDTVEDLCEPYLIQEGFIHRTPRGRMATKLAFEHFGRECVQNHTPDMF